MHRASSYLVPLDSGRFLLGFKAFGRLLERLSISYRRLRRNPERYTGLYTIFSGSIMVIIFICIYAWLAFR